MRADRRAVLAALVLGTGPALADPALPALEAALPAGAQETVRVTDPPGPHAIAIGPAGPMAPPPERVQNGTRLRIAWAWPAGNADTIESGLTDALDTSGFTPLYTCRTQTCGGFDFRLALPVLPLPDMAVDLGDFRYMAAAREDPPALAALLLSAGPATTHAQFTLVTTVPEASEAPQPSIASPPQDQPTEQNQPAEGGLATRLETVGRAVLEGLDFAPGGTALTQGDAGRLSALVAWLAADPARRVALVGHTDWTGSPDANMALSRARAAAVAAALEDMGATPAQITVAGVGPFAPRSANSDPDGLSANRRVEVVRLPDAR